VKTILNLDQKVIAITIFVICLQLIDRMHADKHIVPTVDDIHKRHVRTKLDIYETLTTGPIIPLGTNSPPVARVIDPVIETLTTVDYKSPMVSLVQ
jgi:hypothetical protein